MKKVGVIGVGHMGQHHAKVYSQLEGCKLVGVLDANEELAYQVAEELGTDDYIKLPQLLAACDSVSITVPPVHQYQVAKQALEAGCDVLLEKPGCTSVSDLEELISIAKSGNLTLKIGFIEQFNPAIRPILWQETPLFYTSFRHRPFVQRTAETGVVFDLMIHDLDLLLQLDPSKCLEISVMSRWELGFLSFAQAGLTFESGLEATLVASSMCSKPFQRTSLIYHDYSYILDLNTMRRGTVKDSGLDWTQKEVNKLELEIKDFLY